MQGANRRSNSVKWLATACVLASVVAVAPQSAVAVPVVAIVLAVYRWPDAALELAVFSVLGLRPSLDVFSVREQGLGTFQVNPAVVFGLFVLVVAACLALRRGRSGRSMWPDARLRAAHLWLFASYGIGLLSGWRLYDGPGFEQGLREIVRISSIVAGFLLVLWWIEADHGRYRTGWICLAVGLLPPLAVATWQLMTGTGYREPDGLSRLQGTFSHPNTFGPYLVPFVLAAVGGAVGVHGKARWWRLAVAATLSALVTLSFSRTAVLVLVFGLLLLPILQARKWGLTALVRASMVVAGVFVVGWLAVGSLIKDRFATLSSETPLREVLQSGVPENSLQWRLINWTVLVTLGMDEPAAGHGTGMTEVLNPIVNQNTGIPFNAHNDFVRLFFETGILGLTCYLIYGVLLSTWALRTARLTGAARSSTAFAVVAAFLSMFFFTAGTTELSLQTALQYELYGMLALLAGGVTGTRDPELTPGLTGEPMGRLR